MPSKRANREHYLTPDADLRLGDCLKLLASVPDKSIDFLLTDPPYFLDQLGDEWSREGIAKRMRRASTVGGLPVGMKFDRDQSKRLEQFFFQVSKHAIRVLKPGAFMVAFSQGRLVHRLATAAEDAGFEIRDLFVWEHE